MKNCDEERGASLLELCVLLSLCLLLAGGIIDWGITLLVGYNAENAVREGARIGSALPGIGENDIRIRRVVDSRMKYEIFTKDVDILNTAPQVARSILNSRGEECNQSVTVSVRVRRGFLILGFFGVAPVTIERSVTNRILQQPLCV